LKKIDYDKRKTKIINPFDAEYDEGEIQKYGKYWPEVRKLFTIGSEISFRYMDLLDKKTDWQHVTIHTFLQNLDYNSLEEINIALLTILDRKYTFKKEDWDKLVDDITKKLRDS